MNAKDTAQKWTSSVNQVTIGATTAEGGTRSKTITIGGARCVPWLAYEGEVGRQPSIAIEIWDTNAQTWSEELRTQYGKDMNNPISWALKAVESGADLICLRLIGTHPDIDNKGPDETAELVSQLLKAVDLP